MRDYWKWLDMDRAEVFDILEHGLDICFYYKDTDWHMYKYGKTQYLIQRDDVDEDIHSVYDSIEEMFDKHRMPNGVLLDEALDKG